MNPASLFFFYLLSSLIAYCSIRPTKKALYYILKGGEKQSTLLQVKRATRQSCEHDPPLLRPTVQPRIQSLGLTKPSSGQRCKNKSRHSWSWFVTTRKREITSTGGRPDEGGS